jgi:hypothetical protein
VNFEVKENAMTSLKVYNLLGQEVATLFDGQAEVGKVYETTMEAGKLARGVYYYTLTNGTEKVTKRMVGAATTAAPFCFGGREVQGLP